MLLLTDGSVLVHQDDSDRWSRLVPDRHGSYANGTWHSAASLPGRYQPQYFASAVLPSGKVIVLGGEYDGSDQQVESNRGAIYDPVANRWRRLAPPPRWTQVGDSQSTLLTDGRLLVANLLGSDDAILDPATLHWTPTGAGKLDLNGEEGFSLLPDGRVLTVDSTAQGSELFNPQTGTWSSAGKIPVNLVDDNSEQGPVVSGPDGDEFAIGATGNSALYHSQPGGPGRWSAGPRLPKLMGAQLVAADAAGARLPNGSVLLDASPPGQVAPVYFFVFNGRDLRPIEDNETARDVSSYTTRMLVLPSGKVLYDDNDKIYVFRPGGSPRADWRPRITAVARQLAPGHVYRLSGLQLAGRDQGAAYGDDFQDNTNYPMIRITSLAGGPSRGVITYARTTSWSSVSTAPGAPSWTRFTVPRDAPAGSSSLVVVASGIGSAPVRVTIR